LDNHKYGDYKPYLIKSTDKGKSWSLINGDLPNTLLTWRLVQDHVKKDLLFVATEYGIYFTSNGGNNWIQLKGGIPTIAFRDITIQRRENDLVGASFGRGFFILDDITPLRNFVTSMLKSEATLFDVKDAYWYVTSNDKAGGQGDDRYVAENPPFGAIFTYFMADKINSLKDDRKEKEKTNTDFPGWDALEAEKNEDGPLVLLIIKDSNGDIVNTVKGSNKKGFNRVNWELNYPNKSGERLNNDRDTFGDGNIMVTPGTFSVTLVKRLNGETTVLQGPKTFNVVPLYDGALPRKSYDEINAFRNDIFAFQQDLNVTNILMSKSLDLVDAMKRAANKTTQSNTEILKKIHDVRMKLLEIQKELSGHPIKEEIGENSNPTPNDARSIAFSVANSTYGPTGTHKATLNRASKQLSELKLKLKTVTNSVIPAIENDLKAAGAPWIEGQGLIDN
jgi:hypothetical protein